MANTKSFITFLLILSALTGCSNNKQSAAEIAQTWQLNNMMLQTIEDKLDSMSADDAQDQALSQKLHNILCELSDEDYVVLNNSEYNSGYLTNVSIRCGENEVEFVQYQDSMHIYSRDLMRDYMNGMVVTKS